jgi:hypothetical protein
MRRFNPRALIAAEGEKVVMIEDHRDPDGRFFRLEVDSSPDGRHAIAILRHNPWGAGSEPHLFADRRICIGPAAGHTGEADESPYDLAYVIPRARLYCTLLSVFHETGSFSS